MWKEDEATFANIEPIDARTLSTCPPAPAARCAHCCLFSEEEKEKKKTHELHISVFHIGLVYASVSGPNRVSAVDLTDTDLPETVYVQF